MAAATAAPPDMSSFMRSMPSAGLIEMPPESNVTPLPTRPSTGVVGAAGGSCRDHDQPRRLRAALRDAEQQSHAAAARMRSSSSTSTDRPAATSRGFDARGELARREHVAGSFDSSRAKFAARPMMRPRRTAAAIAPASAPGAVITTFAGGDPRALVRCL